MSYRQTVSSYFPIKGFQLNFLQPAQAWAAILALAFFTLFCIVVGAGKILNLAFPVGAFAVGAFLYFRAPVLYIGFSWWMWFLTALIRRLADYRGGGFTDPSPILLAPYLVMMVTLVTLWQHLPKVSREGGLPFVLALVGIFYGFLVGLIFKPPIVVGIALLDWLTPVLFGLHLFVNWQNYPSYRQNIQRTFLWGVLVMGIYGLVQFLALPEWDRFWLFNVDGMLDAAGNPDNSAGMRIWSTMHSGEPFSAVMAGSLLLLFSCRKPLSPAASVAGYLAFLLAQVRAGWIGWFAGFLIFVSSLKANLQMRLIITALLMAVCIFPLATMEPFSERIGARMETLSNVQEDGSAKSRQELFKQEISRALLTVVGDGIGGETYDNAILAILFKLGWVGSPFYVGGMFLLVFRLFQGSEGSSDLFLVSARALVVSGLVRLPVNSPLVEVSGVAIWGFLGMGLAAKKYYQHQHGVVRRQFMQRNQ